MTTWIFVLTLVAGLLPMLAVVPAAKAKTAEKAAEYAPGVFCIMILVSANVFLVLWELHKWSRPVTGMAVLGLAFTAAAWHVMDLTVRDRQSEERKAAFYAK